MQDIGRYHILSLIGAGGMGTIYKAQDTRDGRIVALKTLHKMFLEKEDIVRRFQTEARACLKLVHPNILRVLDCDRTPDTFYLAMEYVEGKSLKEYIKALDADLPEQVLLRIFSQICDAMGFAHQQGVLHRDLSASNVVVRDTLDVTIIDFGLSKLATEMTMTLTGTIVGTPEYMAPEQFTSLKEVDERADIWSMGILLYELIARRSPYGETIQPVHLTRKIVDAQFVPPPPVQFNRNLPAKYDWIVQRALERDLDGRYRRVEDMLRDMKAHPDDVKPPGKIAPERRVVSRLRYAAAIAIGVCAIVLLTFFILHRRKAEPPLDRATSTAATAAETAVSVALKEMAPNAEALARGMTIFGYRKQVFKPGKRFVLYPTYRNVRPEKFKEKYRPLVEESLAAKKSGVSIKAYAILEDSVKVTGADMERLDPYYVWTQADMLDYCGNAQNVYVVFMRVYRLPQEIEIPSLPSGAVIFANLDTPVSVSGSTPVLDDDAYGSRKREILTALGRGLPEGP
ncbi:MAG: hypothetical protein A3G34_04475 [Candidatus Lindowbacteria bacterium RIFCSPLOWO2_12_FULL_62_27]|nr:MAG: hypothetical protein A3G34_04475 [Candidatus Lindowbacteria bacterium RIFCSPLOWO2_12_FULL_62_27]